MTEKTANVYTDEVVAEMVEAYTAAETQEARDGVVAEFAERVGKTVASVRAKLVRENVYIKKERTDKTGAKVITKDQMVTNLEAKMGLEPGDLDSLEKATKRVLKFLDAAIPAPEAE